MFIIVIFIVCVGGGWSIGKLVGTMLSGKGESLSQKTFIDKSVHHHHHHHYHDNRSVHIDGEEFKKLRK